MPVWGEEGVWDQSEAAKHPTQRCGAGGSAKLSEEAAEITRGGREGKGGQGLTLC